jgi:hypothetical protein
MDPQELFNELIDKSLSGFVYDMAAVVHTIYREKYVCAKLKSRQWFMFDGLKWCYTEIGPYHDISIHIVGLYENMLSNDMEKSDGFSKAEAVVVEPVDQQQPAQSQSQPAPQPLSRQQLNEWEICKKRIVRLEMLIAKLKNVTYKESVCREAMYLFYNPDFLNRLDKYRHLVCFKNGVLDLHTKEFRIGRRDDYISLYMDDDYMSPLLASDTSFQQKIEKFMAFRENIIVKRKGSQFKFSIGSEEA